MKTLANIFKGMVTLVVCAAIGLFLLCVIQGIEEDKQDWRNYDIELSTSDGVEFVYKPDVENVLDDAIGAFTYTIDGLVSEITR